MSETATGFTQFKRKTTLTDQVHDRILEMIIKNPSDEEQILNEKRLTELFGVSKAPVREALIRLCSEGVLVSVPRFGYMVVQMSEKDAADILRMRITLEKEALLISFPGLNEAKLEQLHSQVRKTEEKTDMDVWQVWEDNEEFHMLLASFSENKVLIRFLRECMGMGKRLYAQKIWKTRNSMVVSGGERSHYEIYCSLKEGDLEKTRKLLEWDISGSM